MTFISTCTGSFKLTVIPRRRKKKKMREILPRLFPSKRIQTRCAQFLSRCLPFLLLLLLLLLRRAIVIPRAHGRLQIAERTDKKKRNLSAIPFSLFPKKEIMAIQDSHIKYIFIINSIYCSSREKKGSRS